MTSFKFIQELNISLLISKRCWKPSFVNHLFFGGGGGEGEGRWGREAKNNRAVPCRGNAVPCNNLRQNLNLKGMEAFSCISTIIKEIPMVSIIKII